MSTTLKERIIRINAGMHTGGHSGMHSGRHSEEEQYYCEVARLISTRLVQNLVDGNTDDMVTYRLFPRVGDSNSYFNDTIDLMHATVYDFVVKLLADLKPRVKTCYNKMTNDTIISEDVTTHLNTHADLRYYFVTRDEYKILKKDTNYQVSRCPPSVDSCCGSCQSRGLMKCGRCKITYYCSKECQKKHWSQHKKVCHLAA
jgi:hypothetical protein